MTDDLYEYLFRLNDDESILNLTQSSETLNVSAAVTENDHLHNRVKPSLGYLTRIRRWVRSRGNVGQIASYTAVVGGLLAGGVFYQIARYVDVPRITFYINDYNVLSGRLSSVSAQAAVVGLVSAMSVAMLTAVILHLVRRKATPPPHGQPIIRLQLRA